jgi:cyclopropane fatty-acyl-phospholipid synthase-like methyltransferase
MSFSQIESDVRNRLYDFHINNTHRFYRKILKRIPNNSTILEVGIGGGATILHNCEMIKSKNLRIRGIDIDAQYLEQCGKIIKDADLSDYVSIKNQDLLTMKETKKYDYILFMESYPVIPINIMNKMMKKCRNLLISKKTFEVSIETNKKCITGGKVIFMHNLEHNKEPIREFLKPRLKYIPFLWVDFGRLTTHTEFDHFIQKNKYRIETKKNLESVLVSHHYNNNDIPECLDNFWKCEQYMIVCSPKYT